MASRDRPFLPGALAVNPASGQHGAEGAITATARCTSGTFYTKHCARRVAGEMAGLPLPRLVHTKSSGKLDLQRRSTRPPVCCFMRPKKLLAVLRFLLHCNSACIACTQSFSLSAAQWPAQLVLLTMPVDNVTMISGKSSQEAYAFEGASWVLCSTCTAFYILLKCRALSSDRKSSAWTGRTDLPKSWMCSL